MSDMQSLGPSLTQADLLSMKVSDILEARPAALQVLADNGFAPLRQAHLRAALAHTVTLAQALRIRSLSESREQALLDGLQALFATGSRPVAAGAGGGTN